LITITVLSTQSHNGSAKIVKHHKSGTVITYHGNHGLQKSPRNSISNHCMHGRLVLTKVHFKLSA